MDLKKNQIELIAFLIVYLFAVYLWTLPFQSNQIPYGEDDAISHWEIADSFVEKDRTYVYLPPFIDYAYSGDNRFKPSTLWYHPPFHTNLAIISSMSSERTVPVYLTNAIFATSILISVFFVIRKLFGFLPAILSSFLLTFSLRDIMPYLWGQWPERLGYAFIPLILYCFYTYYLSYTKEKNKPIYLYLTGTLLGIQIMMHPLSFFHSVLGILVLGVMLAIKEKKLPTNFKHIGISLLIFLVLLSIFPYQTGNILKTFTREQSSGESKSSFERIFQWSLDPQEFGGSVPPSYFSYREMHGAWTLPFLLIGIAVLLIRRQNKDIFLLAWLVSLYLVLHRDMIGKTELLHRSLSASAHIFIPITVIGILAIPYLIKVSKKYAVYLKYAAALSFVVLALIYNFPQAKSSLENAYNSPFSRLNPAQIEVSEWLMQNTQEDQNVSLIGPPPQLMQRTWWIGGYSQRVSQYFEGFLTWNKYKSDPEIAKGHLLNDYLIFDYSDIGRLSDQSLANQWLAFEQQNMGNHTLLYNKNNVRVYRYEP